MSYFMTPAKIVQKLASYSHQDLNHAPFSESVEDTLLYPMLRGFFIDRQFPVADTDDWIKECLTTGRDLYDRTGGEIMRFQNCSGADLPQALLLNRVFFAHMCPLEPAWKNVSVECPCCE